MTGQRRGKGNHFPFHALSAPGKESETIRRDICRCSMHATHNHQREHDRCDLKDLTSISWSRSTP